MKYGPSLDIAQPDMCIHTDLFFYSHCDFPIVQLVYLVTINQQLGSAQGLRSDHVYFVQAAGPPTNNIRLQVSAWFS